MDGVTAKDQLYRQHMTEASEIMRKAIIDARNGRPTLVPQEPYKLPPSGRNAE